MKHNRKNPKKYPKQVTMHLQNSWNYIDKSMSGFSRESDFADITISARIGNDFSNGNRGMAKAVKGAKKFVNSRIRFHENLTLKKLIKDL